MTIEEKQVEVKKLYKKAGIDEFNSLYTDFKSLNKKIDAFVARFDKELEPRIQYAFTLFTKLKPATFSSYEFNVTFITNYFDKDDFIGLTILLEDTRRNKYFLKECTLTSFQYTNNTYTDEQDMSTVLRKEVEKRLPDIIEEYYRA